jgi:DNA repair protein RadD
MATGGGKSVMTAHRARLCRGASVIMAHRQELVYQLSMALARDEIEHRIMAPDAVIKHIIEKQIAEFNRNYVYERAQHTVASVDTLIARADKLDNWPRQVELVQIDEAHHVLGGDHINKWGRAFNIFPQALRIGWTGTGMRPDRKPLRSAFDSLVVGPTTAELLALGCLCPYRVYGPPSSIDVAGLEVGGSGDYSGAELRKRAHKSTVTGDMVQHYLKLTPGAVGIAFLVDVEQAKETAERFNAAGVPAAWMSSRETDDRTRVRTMDALRSGALKLICNVDLLGEGVDVPRVEVVLDGRPTMSLVRYLQVFGRLLRTYPGKEHGVYIDLVGNVVRHGLPDTPRTWTLDVPEKRKRTENDETALKACPQCFQVFERFLASCPHCGFKPTPAGRSRPEEVDGDLTEFSEELLARLRGQAAEIMGPCPPGVAPYVVQNWNARAVTQQQLRDALAMWQGVQEQRHGYDIATGSRLFWHRFGIDAATAQTLGRKQAAELYDRVWGDINNECARPKRGPVDPVVVDEDDRPERLGDGQRVGISPQWNNKEQKWKCEIRVDGKIKAYLFKDKSRCQEACNWSNDNRNQQLPEYLDDRVRKVNFNSPIWHKIYQLWQAHVTVNGKRITYSYKDRPRCQMACDWSKANPNQYLPEYLDDRVRKKGIINGKYQARVWHKGKEIHLGRYNTLHEKLAVEDEYRRKHNIPRRFTNVDNRNETR